MKDGSMQGGNSNMNFYITNEINVDKVIKISSARRTKLTTSRRSKLTTRAGGS